MRRQKYFNGQDKHKLKLLIQEKTGYCIRSSCALSQAFRRRSFCAEEEGKSNEMFEFIGDQVLSYRRIPVRIMGAFTEPVQPYLIEPKMTDLLTKNEERKETMSVIERIALFHLEFEGIHPSKTLRKKENEYERYV